MMASVGSVSAKTLGQLLPELSLSPFAQRLLGRPQLDSRRVQNGDTFLALSGTQTHGEQFIADAIAHGAAAVMSEASGYSVVEQEGVLRIGVEGLAQQASAIAGRYFGFPSEALQITAVTGTNGKTTCAQWLAQLLTILDRKAASVGTLGFGLVGEQLQSTGLTTPDAVELQRILQELLGKGAQAVVMEASSHSLDQHRLAGVAVDVAIFTNIGRDHLDYHGDMASYVAAKKRLLNFSQLSAVVINKEDVFFNQFINDVQDGCRLLTFAVNDLSADFCVTDERYLPEGIKASLQSPEGEFDLQLPVWGEFNLSNVLAVIAAAYAQGFRVAAIVQALAQLQPVTGRLQQVVLNQDGTANNANNIQVLVDFAHTADALQSVLQALRAHTHNKLWCVFGCGGDRDKGKRPLMAAVAEQYADHVVVTSDNPRHENTNDIINDITAGFTHIESVMIEADREQAIAYAIAHAKAGDCVLLAGKGHEDYQLMADTKVPFSDLLVAQQYLQQRVDGGDQ